jgi:hypothetical protein
MIARTLIENRCQVSGVRELNPRSFSFPEDPGDERDPSPQ